MKKMSIKIAAAFMTALLLMLTLLGCSAKEAYTENMAAPSEAGGYAYGSYEFDDYAMSEEADYGMALNGSAEYETAAETVPAQSDNAIERKIIRNASIEMEAENAQECYNSILAFAKQLGGYESSCQNRVDEYSSGTYIYINAELRLPPEKLDEFVGKTGEYGEVTYSNVSQNEITEEYYDLTTRLASKNAALSSYYGLLEKAETITDILEIQARIDELTEEIESIKGRLRVYDNLVDESTAELSITEYIPAEAAEKEFEWDSLSAKDFGKIIKNGFLSVANFTWSLLLWTVIILVSTIPLLILGGIVFFIIRGIRRKSRKSKAAKQENTVSAPASYVDNASAVCGEEKK